MNKIILTTLTIIISLTSFAQTKPIKTIRDGLYLIVKIDTTAAQIDTLSSKEISVAFSKLFEDFNSNEYLRIIIDTTEFVPLELDKAPTTEQQTEAKKKLLLSLTKEASDKLKAFSTVHVMNLVAIVVDGEALTMHKIKEPITSGQLQITRCNDNACERLYMTLKDNIKERKK